MYERGPELGACPSERRVCRARSDSDLFSHHQVKVCAEEPCFSWERFCLKGGSGVILATTYAPQGFSSSQKEVFPSDVFLLKRERSERKNLMERNSLLIRILT